MNKYLSIIYTLLFSLLFTACGGGSSSSGVDPSVPGQNLPPNFVGVYKGTLNLTAEAIGITETDTVPITITVLENGTIRFDGDDPEETFTVGITDAGDFSGNASVNEDPCTGTIAVVGRVDGTTASGTVQGNGECEESGLRLDVDLTGDFSATK